MDALLGPEHAAILEGRGVRELHRRYLIVARAQWLGCNLLSAWTMRARTESDAAHGGRLAG
jgi:hypothetical protein